VRVVKWAVERAGRVGVQERALNLIVAVAVRQRCMVGLTARQVTVLRLAIAIVSTSLICHVDGRNAGKTRAGVSVDGQWEMAKEMR